MRIFLRTALNCYNPHLLCSRSYFTNFQQLKDTDLHKIALTVEENVIASRKWTYPSDHLPVFGQVNGLRIATFNILNSLYVDHLLSVQGWSESYIVRSERERSLVFSGFSYREEEICRKSVRLLREDPSVEAVCIQECSDRMFHLLKNVLEPLKIAVILGDGKRKNHVVTLVNTELYSVLDVQIIPVFQRYIKEKEQWFWDIWRPAVDLVLEEKPNTIRIPNRFRVMNLHISSAGQTPDYKIARLCEVSAYIARSSFAKGPTITCGDFNACKSLAGPVFMPDSFESLCSHHSQIENIVATDNESPSEPPHLVSIDDLLVTIPKGTELFHEMFPIHPSQTSDIKAALMLKDVFDPLVQSRRI